MKMLRMKRKTACILCAAVLACGLCGCGGSKNKDDASTSASVTETQLASAGDADTASATDVATNGDADIASATDVEAGPGAAVGEGDWVDFDDMCFYINGEKYVLGKSTMQDLFDNEAPFAGDTERLASFMLAPDTETNGSKIYLESNWYAQVYALNNTDEERAVKDCIISEIYLPVNPDQTQDVIGFHFPLNLTEEELVEMAGEPKEVTETGDKRDYVTKVYKYEKEAVMYYGYSRYSFKFTNGQLRSLTISYTP